MWIYRAALRATKLLVGTLLACKSPHNGSHTAIHLSIRAVSRHHAHITLLLQVLMLQPATKLRAVRTQNAHCAGVSVGLEAAPKGHGCFVCARLP